ncbi:DUF3804 family protein [Xenorhabdus sp. KJ12.1]|uniref:DUF3804 family protein n=1 Tax=Xenorhabdus sp. KJ12.1 TaxID=1851571 RepID=UPI0012908799
MSIQAIAPAAAPAKQDCKPDLLKNSTSSFLVKRESTVPVCAEGPLGVWQATKVKIRQKEIIKRVYFKTIG